MSHAASLQLSLRRSSRYHSQSLLKRFRENIPQLREPGSLVSFWLRYAVARILPSSCAFLFYRLAESPKRKQRIRCYKYLHHLGEIPREIELLLLERLKRADPKLVDEELHEGLCIVKYFAKTDSRAPRGLAKILAVYLEKLTDDQMRSIDQAFSPLFRALANCEDDVLDEIAAITRHLLQRKDKTRLQNKRLFGFDHYRTHLALGVVTGNLATRSIEHAERLLKELGFILGSVPSDSQRNTLLTFFPRIINIIRIKKELRKGEICHSLLQLEKESTVALFVARDSDTQRQIKRLIEMIRS